MSAFKRYRDVGIVILLLAVPFFFLRANMKDPSKLNALDRVVLRISAPIEFAASSLARGVSNIWESYVYLVDVKADNERLAYDNARLREQVHRLEQKETENHELRRLLQLRESLPGDLVSAQVVGKDFTEFFRVTRVVLDRGSRNIRPHMPVVSPDGVVGAVLRVAGDAVDVQLSVDAAFGIDVEDERTHARGFVRGTGNPSRYSCKVENVDSRDEVEIGDLLVTSGKGKWFPKGLPVARVTKVVKREPGRDQEIEATPTVNFSRLDAVLILVTPPQEEDAPKPSSSKSNR
ncbi:Rod shape-determining protein MreC [Labilithrix luteola]|uniref:Cell shape-determining protein MreC n=1 Tax=Labilithrix luteola TaxID=1391654 RepID=A0A0K1Q338_9BACT|nr:rod shape-determining protein MreC [Labilithrix luteola]AKU99789.1 Rod shape-determining protein MreC [Labilithrix luteola]